MSGLQAAHPASMTKLVRRPQAATDRAPLTRTHADAELTRLAAEFQTLEVLREVASKAFFDLPNRDPGLDAAGQREIELVNQQDAIADRMKEVPARTLVGCVAKAAVSRLLFLRYHDEEIAEGCMDDDDAFAWSLLNDMHQIGKSGA
jgi:hypothetical protein